MPESLLPLIKWSGGKSDEIGQFKHYIPEVFNYYLEPFVGGASVFFNLRPQNAVLSDVHPSLIKLYQAIKDGSGIEIHEFMESNPNNEETYYRVRSMKPENDLEEACQFYYLRKTCYRGMLRYNKKGGFNIPFGKYSKINYDALLETEYYDALQNAEIRNTDYKTIFNEYNDENNFMFLDPPYDSKFTDYGYCSFDKENQKELAKCFKETDIKCLMIIGKTDFIEELYDGYIVDEYDKNYRFRLHSERITRENIDNKHLVIKNY